MARTEVLDLCSKEVAVFDLPPEQALLASFEREVMRNYDPQTYKKPSEYGVYRCKNGDLQLWRFVVKASKEDSSKEDSL